MQAITKNCTKCLIDKSLDAYWALKTGKYGKRSVCIPCTQEDKRIYRAKNKEKLNQYSRDYNKANWDWLYEKQKEYWTKNLAKYKEKDIQHHVKRQNRIPKWLDATHRNKIVDFVKNKPEGSHIDHIIPLNGENVCGLHVIWNLQYLPKDQNYFKHNQFDGTYENNGWKLKWQSK